MIISSPFLARDGKHLHQIVAEVQQVALQQLVPLPSTKETKTILMDPPFCVDLTLEQ